MESVSNYIGNLLSIDDGTSTAKTTDGSSTHTSKTALAGKKRRSLDLDFSSFWKDSTNAGNGGRHASNKKGTAGEVVSSDANTTGNMSNANAVAAAASSAASGSGSGSGFGSSSSSSSAATGKTNSVGTINEPAAKSSLASLSASFFSTDATSNPNYLADKLMEKVIAMIIPNEIIDDHTTKILQERADMAKLRKPLSFPIMQKNSNLLHQRNSDIYIFFNKVLKYVNWIDPYYTVGITLIITHLILKPVLFTVLPFVFLCVNTLIPHYLIVYPPDTTSYEEYIDVNPYPSQAPLDTYIAPKPVALFSKEFFMNLTDTQNFMQLNILLFDFQVWLFTDYFYFKNEKVSSIIVLVCLSLLVINLYLMPHVVRFLLRNFWIAQMAMVVQLWCFIIVMHPNVRNMILKWLYNDETRLDIQNRVNHLEDGVTSILVDDKREEKNNLAIEEKQIEIYELQRMNQKTNIWELLGFTDDVYTKNGEIRKYNHAIKQYKQEQREQRKHKGEYRDGHEVDDSFNADEESLNERLLVLNTSESLKEIQPPLGYKFVPSSKWVMDFNVHRWVEDNLIEDMVLIDDNEKWAYDIILKGDEEDVENERGENKWEGSENIGGEKRYKDKVGVQTDSENTDKVGAEESIAFSTGWDDEVYRRRRWLRTVVRETYHDKERPAVQPSHLAAWVS